MDLFAYAPATPYWRTDRVQTTTDQKEYADDTPFMRQNMGYLQYQLRRAVPYKGERRKASYESSEKIEHIISDQGPMAAAMERQAQEVTRPLILLNEVLSKYNGRDGAASAARRANLRAQFKKRGQAAGFERAIYGKVPVVYRDRRKT